MVKTDLRLLQNVRPPDWVNPEPASSYNLVVIGGGTAGLVTAAGAAGLGAKVALIEKNLLGGDCLNYGCVPSKALIRSARAVAAVRDAGGFGVRLPGEPEVAFGAVMERMRRLRSDISRHDAAARFRGLGVDVFLGEGRFVGEREIGVGEQRLRFANAVIATGARPAAPPIPGLADVPYLTNETLFDLTELPRRFGVIGAGPIGCEMAQAFARFGAEVYLVESAHGVLPREDREAAKVVEASMLRDGVQLLCCGKEPQVRRTSGGVGLRVESHDHSYDVEVDQLLVAVGRRPNIEDVGLEAAGIEVDTKGLKVSPTLRTSNPRVFACGDVCGLYQFTHVADFMARIVIGNALFKGRSRVDSLIVPWATYTSPELAQVGMTDAEAKRRNIDVDFVMQDFAEVDRAVLDGEPEGFARVLLRKGTDKLVGATVVASNAGDFIGELTLAMRAGIGLKKIASTIHPYPTQAEAIRKLGDQFNRRRLTPRLKGLIEKWLKWTR